ncbi:MAG: Rho-binding antiterminator [Colwellia sp.]|nr:Rho-binding antiterminator [Colwellia sp.]
MNNIIACDLHDYVEIACLFAYQVKFELKSGQTITAIPVTTKATIIAKGRQEFLLLKALSDTEQLTQSKILLTELKSMTVLTEDARFSYIEF